MNMNNRYCNCGQFQLSCLPCVHAQADIRIYLILKTMSINVIQKTLSRDVVLENDLTNTNSAMYIFKFFESTTYIMINVKNTS